MDGALGWLVTASTVEGERPDVRAVQHLIASAERGLRDVCRPVLSQLSTWVALETGKDTLGTPVHTRWQTWPLGTSLPSTARPVAVLDVTGELLLASTPIPAQVLVQLRGAARAGQPVSADDDHTPHAPLHLHYPAKHTYLADGKAHVTGDREAVRLADAITGTAPDGTSVIVKPPKRPGACPSAIAVR